MATTAQATKVGVFLVGVGVVGALVLFAISGFSPTARPSYRIRFQDDVTGLSNGSKVLFRGVDCGRVVDLIVDASRDVIVTIEIKPRAIPPLHEGVTAQLSPVGISGLMQIVLEGGEEAAVELQDGDFIPSRPSFLQDLVTNLPQIQEKIQKALEVVSGIFARVEPEDVRLLVRDARELTGTLAAGATDTVQAVSATLLEYHALAADARRAINEISPAATALVADITQYVRLVGPKVAEAIPEIGRAAASFAETLTVVSNTLEGVEAEQLGADVRALVNAAREAVDRFGTVAETLDEAATDVGTDASLAMRDLRDALLSLEETLRAVKRLAEYLERDPAALLHGKSAPDSRERRAP